MLANLDKNCLHTLSGMSALACDGRSFDLAFMYILHTLHKKVSYVVAIQAISER